MRKFFDKSAVEQYLTYPVCIQLMKECLTELETGDIEQPVRSGIGLPQGGLAYMPCVMHKRKSFGAKLISVYPGNASKGYPSHQGDVIIFEEPNGSPVASADAAAITEIRTACASAAATDILARNDSHILAILGSGAQARTHIKAMCEVRDIKEIYIWSYHFEHAERFVEELQSEYNIPLHVCTTVKEAVINADIICTVSRAEQPILNYEWVKPGTHINAVGTCSPVRRELSDDLVAAGKLYADQIEACKAESGDYLIPLKNGTITEQHLLGSVGSLLLGTCEGRTKEEDITIFDSLGLAAEDVICADYLCKNC